MAAITLSRSNVRFGTFRLDLSARKLYKGEHRVKLSGQSLRILALLVQEPRRIVTREEIIAELWAGSIHVDFDNGINTAIKKLRVALGDSASNPRFIETVQLQGYRFIAPIEEVEITAHSPSEHLKAPALKSPARSDPSEQGAESRKPRLFQKTTRKTFVFASAVAVCLAIVGLSFALFRKHPAPTPPLMSMSTPRKSVAVVGFKNLSARASKDWLSTLLSEELAAELGAGEDLRAISGENVVRMKRDLLLPEADTYARDTLIRIRDYLGTDYVVVGSYFEASQHSKEGIRVDVRLQDAATGETVASITNLATESELSGLVSRTGATLRQRLGLGSLSTAQDGSARATLPTNLEAARFYSDGLMKLRSLEYQLGQDLLKKAVAADPAFPLAHAALAESWSALGYGENAKNEAAQASRLAVNLSRQDQLSVQALYFELNHDWAKAIQTYQTLFNFFPDNLEYGIRLANAQSTAGKGKDALATVESLRKFPLPNREDPRIDLAEARAAKSLGDYSHERAAAASAGTKAMAQGARIGVAEAKLEEGGALDDLGQPKAAVELEGEAKTIFGAVGDQGGVARALNDIGTAVLHQGNLVAADRMYAESSELATRVGDMRLLAKSLNNIAIVRYRQGNLREAARASERDLNAFHEIGDREGVATSLNNIAAIFTDLGNLSGAAQKYEESLSVARENNDNTSVVRTLGNLARLLMRQGDLAGAEKRYQEAFALDVGGREQTYAVQGLGDVLFWRGDFDGAKNKYEEALALRVKIADEELAAESRLALAEVLVELGHFRQAQEKAQEAADEFRKAGNGDDEAVSESILAQALLRQGMTEQAREIINQAFGLAKKSEDHDVQLRVGIESARVLSATGDTPGAIKRLHSLLAEANKYTYYSHQLEASLLVGELEMGPDAKKGRSDLAALAKEASIKGFQRVANLAERAMRSQSAARGQALH